MIMMIKMVMIIAMLRTVSQDNHRESNDTHDNTNNDDDHTDQDDQDDVETDNHPDASPVNALTLHPPSPLPTKASLSPLIRESSPPYQPQSLSFRQYANRIQET